MEQKKPDKLPVSLTVFWLGSVCSCIIIASHSNLDKIKIWDVTKWHSPGSDILLYIQLLGFDPIWADCFHNYYTATSSKNWPEKQARSFLTHSHAHCGWRDQMDALHQLACTRHSCDPGHLGSGRWQRVSLGAHTHKHRDVSMNTCVCTHTCTDNTPSPPPHQKKNHLNDKSGSTKMPVHVESIQTVLRYYQS